MKCRESNIRPTANPRKMINFLTKKYDYNIWTNDYIKWTVLMCNDDVYVGKERQKNGGKKVEKKKENTSSWDNNNRILLL